MMITEVFKDIRLVGAPPSNIGKFGGDTDNWMWPRHTGDFSLFRIYVDKDGNPAEYSEENVPYQPKYYFPISIDGVEEDDFTFVFGYPARTNEYLPSYAVEMITEQGNPKKTFLNFRNSLLMFQVVIKCFGLIDLMKLIVFLLDSKLLNCNIQYWFLRVVCFLPEEF
jgi:hypothetical protein